MINASVARIAWALTIWGSLSILLILVDAPVWLRLPIVGLFSVLGVGCAAVLALRIRSAALAVGTAVATGLASLMACSLITLYAGDTSGFGTLVIQAAIVWGLSAWVLRRETSSAAPR